MRRAERLILISMCLSLAAVVSAVSALNVALPDLARATGASTTELQWIVDALSGSFGSGRSRRGALGLGQLGERERVPIRIGDVHVADAVRVGLDRLVLDALRRQALEQRVEPGDGEGDAARAGPRCVRLDEERCVLVDVPEDLFADAKVGARPKNRVYQSMPASRSDTGTPAMRWVIPLICGRCQLLSVSSARALVVRSARTRW